LGGGGKTMNFVVAAPDDDDETPLRGHLIQKIRQMHSAL